MTNLIVWGKPRGETDPLSETLLAETCRTERDVQRVIAAASGDGWHSFRVTTYSGEAPDFTNIFSR